MNIKRKWRNFMAIPTVGILFALSASHCLNDLLQSVITAIYPMLKQDLGLNFAQIGLITLVYQIAASVFQPVVGYAFDRYPKPWSLPAGMCFTTIGITLLALSDTLTGVLLAVAFTGIGSSTLHPEASRITSLAGKGRRGLAQSVFQVGGNFGGSIGPLLVALIVAPHSRRYVLVFLLCAAMCFMAMRPIVRWYSQYLRMMRQAEESGSARRKMPLPMWLTVLTVIVIMLLIFSKYIYMASITGYYTFYLMEHFGVSMSVSQICLFVFLFSTAAGTLVGGPVGDRIGRKKVIVISILGAAPFSMLMPHLPLWGTIAASFCTGFVLSSAFPAILLYAQELIPAKLGLVSGMFFGFAFGVAGIASAFLGEYADLYGIEAIYKWCAYMPLLGVAGIFLPELKGRAVSR